MFNYFIYLCNESFHNIFSLSIVNVPGGSTGKSTSCNSIIYNH